MLIGGSGMMSGEALLLTHSLCQASMLCCSAADGEA